jgi:hypothetical protein
VPAASSTAAASRSSAPLAFTVRSAPSARSSTEGGRARVPDRRLRALHRARNARQHDDDEPSEHDEHADRDAQQREVDDAHEDDGPDEHERPGDRVHDARGGHRAQQHGVRGHARQQVPRREAVQLGDPQAQQAADEPPARAQDDGLGGALEHEQAGRRQQRADHDQRGQHEDRPQQRRIVGERVDHRLRRERLGQRRAPAQQSQEPAGDERPPVGPNVLEQQRPRGCGGGRGIAGHARKVSHIRLLAGGSRPRYTSPVGR